MAEPQKIPAEVRNRQRQIMETIISHVGRYRFFLKLRSPWKAFSSGSSHVPCPQVQLGCSEEQGSREPQSEQVGQLRSNDSGWDQDGVSGSAVKAVSKVTGRPAGKKLVSRVTGTL